MNLEEHIRSEREAIEQMDLSDELREEVFNLLDFVNGMDYFWVDNRVKGLKLVKTVTENTGSVESLGAVKRILNHFGRGKDFENYSNLLSFASSSIFSHNSGGSLRLYTLFITIAPFLKIFWVSLA